MQISFLNLRRNYEELEQEIHQAIAGVFAHGVFILGPEVTALESGWAEFNHARACAAVGNGTDALKLALLASGAVRPGRHDEIITSPLTAAYTALAIMDAGGVPVFADIDPITCNLHPEAIAAQITPRTRAIVPVHLYGQMAAMTAIHEIATQHNLLVIEDAAQAHGARHQHHPPGKNSIAATWSFYPTKNLGAFGDAGAVTSDDAALIEKIRLLRQGGNAVAISGNIAGGNSRLDELHAAILRVKLRKLNEWNARRRTIASFYSEALRHGEVQLPMERKPDAHAWHLYVVQHKRRDALREHLASRGIETLIHYPYLLHQQNLFRRAEQMPLPNAERVVQRIVSLPLYPQLPMSEAERVAEAVSDFLRHSA
jgi:dTDP-4-amino-4,6-dideoxygalactose transaminase